MPDVHHFLHLTGVPLCYSPSGEKYVRAKEMKQQLNHSVDAEICSPMLAYGVEPSKRKYRLRLARYKTLGEAVLAFVRKREKKRTVHSVRHWRWIRPFFAVYRSRGSGKLYRFLCI
jgi:hypothetical protein